ncbi:hypothetical protein GJAV_G00004580 [Gymnothorax javanicus]|nr:hypothetical protein GJAV_G00004580 [Gymnothorax javanicus]
MGRVPLYLCVFLCSFYPFECDHDNTEDAAWHVEPLFTESDAGFHMPELFAGEDANENGSRIPLPSPYLTLPVFKDSIVPLVNKELLNPTRMTGLEPMPGKLRKVLLPSSPHSHPTTRPSSGRKDVVVSCGKSKMRVVVRKRTLGSRASASQLTLGTCGVSDETEHFFIFSNNVSCCGSEKSIINNQLVYSNTLYYTPEAPTGLIRTAVPFALSISCHYNRFYYSYKIGYLPDIKTHQIFRSMSQSSDFTLTPCDDRWERLPETQGYIIGSIMYFEARSPPLSGDQRLFISFCYATPSQNVSDTLRFSVIENYGCMADSKVPLSQSRFIRYKRNVLRFTVEAFLFEGMTAERVHMHCEMFVANHTATPTAKSCTYNSATDRWEELYNDTQVCSCCDSTCVSTEAELPATKKIVTSGSWTLEPDNGTVVGEATVEWDEVIPTVAMAVIKPMVKEVTETVTKMVTEPEIGRKSLGFPDSGPFGFCFLAIKLKKIVFRT